MDLTKILTLYIAGPMTGYVDKNFPAFYAADEFLFNLGIIPLNPADKESEDLSLSWAQYMKEDMELVDAADGIALLPDWQKSRGAWLEVKRIAAARKPMFLITDEGLAPITFNELVKIKLFDA